MDLLFLRPSCFTLACTTVLWSKPFSEKNFFSTVTLSCQPGQKMSSTSRKLRFLTLTIRVPSLSLDFLWSWTIMDRGFHCTWIRLELVL